jgi:hypothetical protein
MKIGSPKFAIGQALQTDVMLKLDDLGNGPIFDKSQLFRRDRLLPKKLISRLMQVIWSEKAPDMVCSEGRHSALVHLLAYCQSKLFLLVSI